MIRFRCFSRIDIHFRKTLSSMFSGKYEIHTSKKLRKEIDAYHPSTPEPRVRTESESMSSLFGGSPQGSPPPADPPEPEQLIAALQVIRDFSGSLCCAVFV